MLRLKGGKYVVRMILDDTVIDRITLTTPLRAGFNLDVRHDGFFPPVATLKEFKGGGGSNLS